MGWHIRRFPAWGTPEWFEIAEQLLTQLKTFESQVWDRMPATPDQLGLPLAGPFYSTSPESGNGGGGGGGGTGNDGSWLLGKMVATTRAGGTGQVNIYAGAKGAEDATGEQKLAYVRMDTVKTGKWVWIRGDDTSGWEVMVAKC